MVLKLIERWIEPTGSMPNRFTIGMGYKIREARVSKGYSQSKLADLIFRRQASLSDMENGKMQPDAETLLYLSLNLDKPISYFYPGNLQDLVDPQDINHSEKELLMQARRLSKGDLKRLIAQARALAEITNDD